MFLGVYQMLFFFDYVLSLAKEIDKDEALCNKRELRTCTNRIFIAQFLYFCACDFSSLNALQKFLRKAFVV